MDKLNNKRLLKKWKTIFYYLGFNPLRRTDKRNYKKISYLLVKSRKSSILKIEIRAIEKKSYEYCWKYLQANCCKERSFIMVIKVSVWI